MSAIVVRESGARPFAIGDNTSRRSYFPATRAGAVALAAALLRRGHDLDLGYAQINSANLAAYELSIERAFEPCTNVDVGARILRKDYVAARRRFGSGQNALAHALSAYNSGGFYASLAYARDVYATAAALRYERTSSLSPSADGPAVTFRRAASSVSMK